MFLKEGVLTFWISRSLKIGVVLPDATNEPEPVPEPDRTRRFAVMIDDHPAAWPQSGLEEAEEIWQLLVEGGITRLLAVYQNGHAEKIGPVRSARPYYIDLAREYDAVFVHVGGSDESLALLRSGEGGLDDADQFRYGAAFWRDPSGAAPHNTYTSAERLRALLEARGWRTESGVIPASIRSETHPPGVPAAEIEVRHANGSRAALFRWNAETSSYDRVGHPQSPATVVVMELDAVPGKDPRGLGLLSMRREGTGRAVVFRNGVAIEGVWKKNGADEQTQFYAPDGKKLAFAPGQAWIHVIAPNRGGRLNIR